MGARVLMAIILKSGMAAGDEPFYILHELQKLLTHPSPRMTQRCAHLHDDALSKASNLAGELFSAARQQKEPSAPTAAPETRVRKKKASVA
jgi:hypothetical protein